MSERLRILEDEIATDPLGRGYSGFSSKQTTDDINTEYRTQSRPSVEGSEILNATDDAEYSALTSIDDQNQWIGLCGVLDIDTSSGVAKSLEARLFGPGTTTRSNLAALRSRPATRGEELGIGLVEQGEVEYVDTKLGKR